MSPLPGPGRARQETIFRDGVLGSRPGRADRPRRARAARAQGDVEAAWAYVAGGAGDGRDDARTTARRSTGGGSCRGCCATSTDRDLSTTVLGTAAARAAAARARRRRRRWSPRDATCTSRGPPRTTGVPYVFSSQGGSPMEEHRGGDGREPAVVPALLEHRRAARRQPHPPGRGDRRRCAGRHAGHHAAGLAAAGPQPRLACRSRRASASRSTPPTRGSASSSQERIDARHRRLASDVEVTLGAVRTLLSITRQHPGRFADNLRSPTRGRRSRPSSTSTPTRR